MDATLSFAIAFALSQIVLSIILLNRSSRSMSLQEKLFFAFLVTVAAYLLYPLLHDHWLSPVQRVVENFLPGVFWLFCCSLFNDRFKIKFWNLCLVGLTVAIPFSGQMLALQAVNISLLIFKQLPQVLEFILLTLALIEVVRHWNNDLVERRRDLRLWFCAIIGLYILGTITLREIILPNSNWLAFWQYFPVGFVCLFTNMLLIQYRPGLLSAIEKSIPSGANITVPPLNIKKIDVKEEIEVPPGIVAELEVLMRKRFIYRKIGLTIGQLAHELDVPEHRLRRIINTGLGFRNFNDYLNGFRIKEVGERLADPSQNDEAVLNIALDAGFRSLSAFNKTFKESFGTTPSAYRQQHNQR